MLSVLRNVYARGIRGIPWLIDTDKFFTWANELRIDPNNPEYSDLMEIILVSNSKHLYCNYFFFLVKKLSHAHLYSGSMLLALCSEIASSSVQGTVWYQKLNPSL